MNSHHMLDDKRINAYIKKESKRKGKCKKCAECCKFILIRTSSNWKMTDYAENFGEPVKIANQVFLKIPQRCKQLDKNDRCKIYKSRPQPCRQFPWPTDPTWLAIKETCGFYFEDYKEKLEMGER